MRWLKGEGRRNHLRPHRNHPRPRRSLHRLRPSHHHRLRNRRAVRVINHLVQVRLDRNLLVPPVPSLQVAQFRNQQRQVEIK